MWLGLESADLTPGQRRTTWLAVMIPYTLWMAVAWSAAINGVFRTDASPLPLLPLAFFLPVIIGTPLLLLSKRVGRLLDAMPAAWLVALQLYRVYGCVFLAAGLHGALPAVFAVPAGIGDALTGLFAVPAAVAVATGTAQGRRAAIAWNIFGLADFAVAITLGMITSPGPFQLIFPNVPSIGDSGYRERADPCIRGAKLDLAARAVAAPTDPTIRRLITFLSFELDKDNSGRMKGWSLVQCALTIETALGEWWRRIDQRLRGGQNVAGNRLPDPSRPGLRPVAALL